MNTHKRKSSTILVAEDDPDDRLLIQEAFYENRLSHDFFFVEDGEELMDYLHQRGRCSALTPRPDLTLLDLNMPRKEGREALAEIKTDPHLRRIPVVVLTISRAEEDILRSYDISAAGFITKPLAFKRLVEVVRLLGKYWFEIVELPSYI
ncbi:MAG: response regulator [Anaerolineales bacterium]